MRWRWAALALSVLSCAAPQSDPRTTATSDAGSCQAPTPAGRHWIAPHSPEGVTPVPERACLDGYAALEINVVLPTRLMAGTDFHSLRAEVSGDGLSDAISVPVPTADHQPPSFITAFAVPDGGAPTVDIAIAGLEDDIVMFSRLQMATLEPGTLKTVTMDFSAQ